MLVHTMELYLEIPNYHPLIQCCFASIKENLAKGMRINYVSECNLCFEYFNHSACSTCNIISNCHNGSASTFCVKMNIVHFPSLLLYSKPLHFKKKFHNSKLDDRSALSVFSTNTETDSWISRHLQKVNKEILTLLRR